MESSKYFRNFLDDIFSLYCKTGKRDIEDIFIRLSQADYSSFFTWLSSNGSIRKSLKNPEVYDALFFLSELRRKYPYNVKISDVVKIFTGKKETRHLPYIISFKPFISDNDVSSILTPFQDIIDVVSTFKLRGSEIDASSVYEDLKAIRLSFDNRKEGVVDSSLFKRNLKQKKEDMFVYLLQRFSNDLAAAAERGGLTDLANKFREKILAKPIPFGLGQYIKFNSISDDQMQLARKMSKYVAKYSDYKFQIYNHDLVDIKFLESAGILTKDDVMGLKEEFERQKDISVIPVGGEGQYSGIDTNKKMSIDQRLNPDYIYMLSMFFVFMQKELNVPSMIFPLD